MERNEHDAYIGLAATAERKTLPPLVGTELRNCVAIRPQGAIGTCGWINGTAWQVCYVTKREAKKRGIRMERGI